jgi:hypothetical protein
LAGSPAVARPIGFDDIHRRISEQKAGAFGHQKFGPRISPKVDAQHWLHKNGMASSSLYDLLASHNCRIAAPTAGILCFRRKKDYFDSIDPN